MRTWERILIVGVCALMLVLIFRATQTAERAAWETRAVARLAGDRLRNIEVRVEAGEQIIDLPETSTAWHLSVFVEPNWEKNEREKEIVSWFSTEPRLIKLRDQVHDHFYTTDSPLYKERYVASVPRVPAVMLQDASGKVHYKVGTTQPIPISGKAMADDIGRLFERFPRPFCPKPKPDETPDEVKPDTTEIPAIVPDLAPHVVEPVQFGFPKWAVFLIGGILGAVGAAVSIFYNIKQHS